MVQTRSRQQQVEKGAVGDSQEQQKPETSPTRKRKADENGTDMHQYDLPVKQARQPKGGTHAETEGHDTKKLLARVLAEYGGPPLNGLVEEEKTPASNVVMAHIFNALLSSTRISHDIAMSTLTCLIEESYHDLSVLEQTSWEQRTEILTRGGYTRYREKTANFLGDLAELMGEKYGTSANEVEKSRHWRILTKHSGGCEVN
ncbi:hypothetical protein SODALDRAFT_10437 [Sodiomyces alkalinus F11]|uniref:Uncharacterized protein n=1 Tax=Sodiomyces alkalinus (strain CBS 110278 / VKM F-3762 / F11) TaxID=1314773 RepID=A0A3N2Q646_SODAK|nr:hypothetical protein SODALDRAFT_10437 [Sodiomyces alkalinus F11]ROT42210.1 hypothetical protein SODALDRAFT_10437 [Sodiomyces alkalinus F11]